MPDSGGSPLINFLRQLLNTTQQTNNANNNNSLYDSEENSEIFHYSSHELDSPYQISIFINDVVNSSRQSSYLRARKKAALKQLRSIRSDNYYSINEICRAWVTSRNLDLETIILEKQWVATSPIRVRVLTMLKQGLTDEQWWRELREIKVVVEASEDSDPIIATTAKDYLWTLDTTKLSSMATAWTDYKLPLIENILVEKEFIPSKPVELRVTVALRLGHYDFLTTSRELAEVLKLCDGPDENLAQRAHESLYQLPESSLDSLYNLWVQGRQSYLVDVINKRGYLPKKIGPARVMVALQLGQWERIAENGKASVVATLVQACTDKDALIAERAQLALAALKKPEAQQELCRLIIKEELPIPQKIALEKGYLPTQAYEKVLFYFATEQWEKYEALDFDYRILRTAYASAEPALRRRLADKVRKAGRTEYLTVIAGSSDLRGANPNMSREEAELLVQLLSDNGEWSKLWPLVYDLPLQCAVQIVKKLTQVEWQPSREDERLLFKQLQPLVQGEILMGTARIEELIPPAVLRTRTRATGRINDVAFAHNFLQIALGTGTGKVILWNMQKGQREKVLTGFAHSIGNLVYTKDGALVCAEKTNTRDGVCGVYAWHGEDELPKRMGEHHGPVTTLAAFNSVEQVLTTGRDFSAKLWNVAEYKLAHQAALKLRQGYQANFWVRGACITPDESEVVFLHEGASLMSLPNFTPLSYAQAKDKGHCAVFTSNGKSLIVGNSYQGLHFYTYEKGHLFTTTGLNLGDNILWQKGQTQALMAQPNSNVIVVGKSDGTIYFYDCSMRKVLGEVTADGQRLTSLKISPDGYFMAVGDSDASFTLWDLRPMEVRSLFGQNLAQASLKQMAALNVLTAPDIIGEFTPNVQRALQFLALILGQSFRHEIELEEMPMLVGGEFDIEIEG